MKTRNGKIARLPRTLRDQLNRRLDDGDSGQELVAWLNGQPEVRQCLAEHFEGRPLSEQNLSEWKAGGFQAWLDQQAALELAGRLTENDDELAEVTGGALTDKMATWVAARYMVAINKLQAAGDDDEATWKQLRPLCRDVLALRRSDQQAERLELEHEKFNFEKKDARVRALEWSLDEANKYPEVVTQFRKAYESLKRRQQGLPAEDPAESDPIKPSGQPQPTPPNASQPAAPAPAEPAAPPVTPVAADQTQSDPIKPNGEPRGAQAPRLYRPAPRRTERPNAPQPATPAPAEPAAPPAAPAAADQTQSDPIKPTTPAETPVAEAQPNPTESDPIKPIEHPEPEPVSANEALIRWHRVRYSMQCGAAPYDAELLAKLYDAIPNE